LRAKEKIENTERQRLAELDEYGVMDTPSDQFIDSITRAAADICKVPIALVTLLDSDRQWFKSKVGLEIDQTNRNASFCQYAIKHPHDLMEVEDASKDNRFANSPFVVGEPHIRFYAGQPLLTPAGSALGTLCVIDKQPRQLNQEQRTALAHLSKLVVMTFESQRHSLPSTINRLAEKAMGYGIVITDVTKAGRPIVYHNAPFEGLLGYSNSDLVGQSFPPLVGEGTHPTERAKLYDAIEQRAEATITLKCYRKDGSAFWNQIQLSPISNSEGLVTHYASVHKDVSEIFETEERATRLGVILEASDNEVYIVDENSLQFLYVNESGLRNTGMTMQEMSSITLNDVGSDLAPKKFTQFAQALRQIPEQKLFFSTYITRKDGSKYPVDVNFQLTIYQGAPAYIAFVTDTTRQRKTEAALAQSQAFLESAPEALIIHNLKGEIKMANTQSVRLFGYPLQRLYQLNSVDLVVERNVARYREEVVNFFSSKERVEGDSLDVHWLAKKNDGTELPIDVRICPIKINNDELFSMSVRDATMRLQAERALTDSKELAEKTTKTKSRFLAAASHDLRQPLQSISMYLSVLKHSIHNPEEALEVCEEATKSLKVMSRLLNSLLDVSELDAGSITPSKRDVSIPEILNNIVSSNQPHADHKRLDLKCEQIADMVVNTDPSLLERIVDNFVSNAIRYTDNGSVIISSKLRETESSARELVISVKDTGIGIPEEQQEDIFEEYHQLENHARDRSKGIGLGLSIVKHIANLLDYKLELSSESGDGSTFSVVLPIPLVGKDNMIADENDQKTH